jgi:DNA-binding MarR family transcriptional regulator
MIPTSSAATVKRAKALRAKPVAATRRRVGAEATDASALLEPHIRTILNEFRLEDVASHLLRRAHFMAEEMFSREFVNESLTPRQKAALIIVYQNPGLNQNALADRLFMDPNTVADMAKRLSKAGLLRRASAKTDQRAYGLFLTPEGARLLNRVMPRDLELERKVLECLPEEYRPLFIKCIRLMVEPRPAVPSADRP